ncbi:hypothetical protein BDV3_000498 [Batrachochytrium dendrobatidis]
MIPTTNHLDNCNAAIPINTNHKRCAIVAVSPHTKLQSPLVRTSVLAPSIASVDSMSLPNALSFDKLSNRTSGIVVSDAISTTSDDPPFHKDISVINSSSTAQNSSAYTDHGLESCQIASMPETTVSIDSNPISTMLNDSTLVHAESLYTEQHVSSDATSLAVPSSILSTVPFEVHRTTITPKSDENTSTTLVNSHINNSYSRNHLIDQPFGTTGLQNLGNTCFMNSALQCLSNTVPLTHYFLFGSWKNEVNSNNPLGMNGRIPKVYANLIHQLWRDDQERPRSFSPREFKHTIGELNPTFQGYGQQDSHELLQSLLDGLHEDLNRIINKEYVEDPEMKDMSEDEFAKVSWNAYCKRNDSIIVDLFQAQLKNRTICQICSNVSVKFDPYMYLQVPIPEPKVVLLEIIALSYIFPGPHTQSQRPKTITVTVPKNSTVKDLKLHTAKQLGWSQLAQTDPAFSMVADIFQCKFYKVFLDDASVQDFGSNDAIWLFELSTPVSDFCYTSELETKGPIIQAKTLLHTASSQSTDLGTKSCSYPSNKNFGNPFAIALPSKIVFDKPIDAKLVQKEIGRILYRHATASLGRYSKHPLFRRVTSVNTLSAPAQASVSSSMNTTNETHVSSSNQSFASQTEMKHLHDYSADTLNVNDHLEMDAELTETLASLEAESTPEIKDRASFSIGSDGLTAADFSGQFNHDASNMSIHDLGYEWEPIPNLFKIWISQDESRNSYGSLYSFGNNSSFKPVLVYPMQDADLIQDTKHNKAATTPVPTSLDVDMSTVSIDAAGVDSAETQTHNASSVNESMSSVASSGISSLFSESLLLNDSVPQKSDADPTFDKLESMHDALDDVSITPQLPTYIESTQHSQSDPTESASACHLIQQFEFSSKTEIHLEFTNINATYLFEEQGLTDSFKHQYMNTPKYSTSAFAPLVDEYSAHSDKKLENNIKSDLYSCLKEFSREEILDGDDTMYCSKCMEHRPIRKKLDIYSSPDILVIHLKRFANTGRGGARRTKLDCMVDAPLEGLDMSQVLACESLLDTDAHLYDLYAVSNHFGGLGGGHYTAFVKNPLNGKWYDCDDSSVSLLNSNRIVTEAAYLLFYTRRARKQKDLLSCIYNANKLLQQQEQHEHEGKRRQQEQLKSDPYGPIQSTHNTSYQAAMARSSTGSLKHLHGYMADGAPKVLAHKGHKTFNLNAEAPDPLSFTKKTEQEDSHSSFTENEPNHMEEDDHHHDELMELPGSYPITSSRSSEYLLSPSEGNHQHDESTESGMFCIDNITPQFVQQQQFQLEEKSNSSCIPTLNKVGFEFGASANMTNNGSYDSVDDQGCHPVTYADENKDFQPPNEIADKD